MAVTINGDTGVTTPGISNSEGYTGDGLTIAAGAPSGAMTLDASGNLGIGTTSPYTKLQVTGTIKVATGNAQGILSLGDGNGSTVNCGVWRGAANAPTTDGNYLNFGGYDGIAFATGAAVIGSQTERARIGSNGELFIGTTTTPNSSNAGIRIAQPGSNYWISYNSGTSSYTQFIFGNANGQVGSISTSGSTTTYATSSDYRLKENIQPMTGALAKVAALKPVTYKWKVDGSDGEGFIAHELAEIVPQCVTGEKDAVDAEGKPVYQGIDTSFLAGLYAAALQELHQIVKDQAAEIAELKAKLP